MWSVHTHTLSRVQNNNNNNNPGFGTGCALELMDSVSLAGVFLVAQHGVRLLLLVAAKQEWCFLVCSSGSPSYPVAWSSCFRHGGFWKNFLFYVPFAALFAPGKSGHCLRPCIFQSFGVWVLPPEHVFGTRAWFNSGYMFYEWLLANFTYFLRVVHSDRGVPLHSAEWRSVHS